MIIGIPDDMSGDVLVPRQPDEITSQEIIEMEDQDWYDTEKERLKKEKE